MEDRLSRDLVLRLGRLERSNRRQRVGLVAGLAALGLAAASGEQPPSVLRAAAVEVVDAEGRVQARLSAAPGGPSLVLNDASGVARVSLVHDADQSGLFVGDASGTTRAGVAHFAHGGTGFALHGEGSKGGAVLYLAKGKGSLSFYGEDGTVLDRFPAPRPRGQ